MIACWGIRTHRLAQAGTVLVVDRCAVARTTLYEFLYNPGHAGNDLAPIIKGNSSEKLIKISGSVEFRALSRMVLVPRVSDKAFLRYFRLKN